MTLEEELAFLKLRTENAALSELNRELVTRLSRAEGNLKFVTERAQEACQKADETIAGLTSQLTQNGAPQSPDIILR